MSRCERRTGIHSRKEREHRVAGDGAAEARHRDMDVDGLASGGYGGGFQLRVGGQTRRRVSRRATDIARDLQWIKKNFEGSMQDLVWY